MTQAPRGTGRPVAMAVALTIGAASHGFGPPPGQVTEVGHWDGFAGDYGDVWGDGDFAYLGHHGASAINIVDVRDPTAPAALVDIAITGFNSIHNVFYDNGYLYMVDSGSSRIAIIDLTTLDPDNPPAAPITTTKWS